MCVCEKQFGIIVVTLLNTICKIKILFFNFAYLILVYIFFYFYAKLRQFSITKSYNFKVAL